MTDLEISKALALAIGWTDVRSARYKHNAIEVHRPLTGPHYDPLVVTVGREFDYRDWNVIGPIAERYDCFPISDGHRWWVPSCARTGSKLGPAADTPQKAIALAVIQGAKP